MMGNMEQMLGMVRQLQEQLREMTVKVTADAGALQIIMNGNQEVVQMHFKPELLEDPAELTKLAVEAYNEAMRESKKMVREEFSKLTGGIPLPSVPGLI